MSTGCGLQALLPRQELLAGHVVAISGRYLTLMSRRVRFLPAAGTLLSQLEVESPRRLGPLLPHLTKLLFQLRIQLVRVEARLDPSGRVERLWLVEFDGAPVGAARRLEIQSEILELLGLLAAQEASDARRARRPSRAPEPPEAA